MKLDIIPSKSFRVENRTRPTLSQDEALEIVIAHFSRPDTGIGNFKVSHES